MMGQNFSWDEMGTFDLPAMIGKVLEVTGQEKIFYIGHSMGTTGYLVSSGILVNRSMIRPDSGQGSSTEPEHFGYDLGLANKLNT